MSEEVQPQQRIFGFEIMMLAGCIITGVLAAAITSGAASKGSAGEPASVNAIAAQTEKEYRIIAADVVSAIRHQGHAHQKIEVIEIARQYHAEHPLKAVVRIEGVKEPLTVYYCMDGKHWEAAHH